MTSYDARGFSAYMNFSCHGKNVPSTITSYEIKSYDLLRIKRCDLLACRMNPFRGCRGGRGWVKFDFLVVDNVFIFDLNKKHQQYPYLTFHNFFFVKDLF